MAARTYRTRLWLRVAVLGGVALWTAVAAFVLGHPQAGAPVGVAALAFVAFFAAYAALYDRTAVFVTAEGFVFRSLFRSVRVRSEEILGVRVVHALGATTYAVRTPRGLLRFTSLLARHRELLGVLQERAGLARAA